MQYAHRFFERRKGRTKINSDSTPSFGHILFLTHTIQIYALDISTFSNKRAGRMTKNKQRHRYGEMLDTFAPRILWYEEAGDPLDYELQARTVHKSLVVACP